jgi:hypothetical protein
MRMGRREHYDTVKGSEFRIGMTILRISDAHLIHSLAEKPEGRTAYFGLDDLGQLGGSPLLLEAERTCTVAAGEWTPR